MRKVAFGVVGCGDVARRFYLPAMRASPDIELAAVCDRVEDRARSVREEFGAGSHYTDFTEMLARADIEAVAVLTNPQFHFSLSLQALKAGKHVFTEKTMCSTLDEADTLMREAKKACLKLGSGPSVMVSAINQRIARMIRLGVIGKVCFAVSHSSHGGPASWDDFATDPTWFYQKGAGPLFDLGIYSLHTLTGILGAAKKVSAVSGISVPEVVIRSGVAKGKTIRVGEDDNTQILLDFGDSTFAYVAATFCMKAQRGPGTVFYGSEGVITSGPGYAPGPLEVYSEREELLGARGWITANPEKTPWGVADGIGHMAACIRDDIKPIISAEHAKHVLEIMLKAYEAARTGTAQTISTTF